MGPNCSNHSCTHGAADPGAHGAAVVGADQRANFGSNGAAQSQPVIDADPGAHGAAVAGAHGAAITGAELCTDVRAEPRADFSALTSAHDRTDATSNGRADEAVPKRNLHPGWRVHELHRREIFNGKRRKVR